MAPTFYRFFHFTDLNTAYNVCFRYALGHLNMKQALDKDRAIKSIRPRATKIKVRRGGNAVAVIHLDISHSVI